jgi:hypothetical protein
MPASLNPDGLAISTYRFTIEVRSVSISPYASRELRLRVRERVSKI